MCLRVSRKRMGVGMGERGKEERRKKERKVQMVKHTHHTLLLRSFKCIVRPNAQRLVFPVPCSMHLNHQSTVTRGND